MNTATKTKTLTATKTFSNFYAADTWARKYARESMHSFHFWKVEQIATDLFAVAIRSKNDGRLAGYAE